MCPNISQQRDGYRYNFSVKKLAAAPLAVISPSFSSFLIACRDAGGGGGELIRGLINDAAIAADRGKAFYHRTTPRPEIGGR